MRLRDIQLILEEELPRLQLGVAPAQQNVTVDFTNRTVATRALKRLGQIPSLSKDVGHILAQPMFGTDSTVFSFGLAGTLNDMVERLRAKAQAIQAFLAEQVPAPPEGFFTVHIPQRDNEPSQLAKRLFSLNMAFEQPVRRIFDNTPIKVTLAEPGSTLVELGLQAAEAAGPVL